MVTEWLRTQVGPSTASRISWDWTAFGAMQIAVPPTTEANRRRNCRVEIFLLTQAALPSCSCPLPGHPLFNMWLQSALPRSLRSTRVKVDGIFTPQTQIALRNFQARARLAPTRRMNRATYLKLLATGQQPAPYTATSTIADIDAAVQELKTKIRNCNAVEDGMGFWRLTCGSAVNRMVAELRSRGAFPGCKRRDRRVSERLYRSITHEGATRCCVAQYRSDLADIIKKRLWTMVFSSSRRS
jgi:Putative peptidoglycan binding domain